MNIQEFIVDSLTGITNGVTQAQQQLKGRAIINPGCIDDADNKAAGHRQNLLVANATMGRLAQIVDFDIAITATEESSVEGGARLKVVGIGIGAEGTTGTSSGSVSHIRFSVPVCLPFVE
jgi:hypothetical protein